MCWKRWYYYHCGRSILQHADAAFRTEIIYGRVRSDSRRNDEIRRSQPQGGIRLQEGRSLSLSRLVCDEPRCLFALRRGPQPLIYLHRPRPLPPKQSTSYMAPVLVRRCYR